MKNIVATCMAIAKEQDEIRQERRKKAEENEVSSDRYSSAKLMQEEARLKKILAQRASEYDATHITIEKSSNASCTILRKLGFYHYEVGNDIEVYLSGALNNSWAEQFVLERMRKMAQVQEEAKCEGKIIAEKVIKSIDDSKCYASSFIVNDVVERTVVRVGVILPNYRSNSIQECMQLSLREELENKFHVNCNQRVQINIKKDEVEIIIYKCN